MLIDGAGKRGIDQLSGLTDTMKRIHFEKQPGCEYAKGDFVLVKVTEATQNSLISEPKELMSIQKYYELFNGNRKSSEYLR